MLKKFFNNLKLAMNMPEKKIITFANQKGGVGKSTLCTLFANALVEAGIPIKVLDYDRQHTIGNRRNDDLRYLNPQDPEKIIERGQSDQFKYEVLSSNLFSAASVANNLRVLSQDDSNLLIDAPGNLLEQGLSTVLCNSDFVVVPFQYEPGSINSTALFINYCIKLKGAGEMKAQLIFVPNHYSPRGGNEKEKRLWEHTRTVFAKYGTVVSPVLYSVELQRINTFTIYSRQRRFIKDTFDEIGKTIFGREHLTRDLTLEETNVPEAEVFDSANGTPIEDSDAKTTDNDAASTIERSVDGIAQKHPDTGSDI